MNLKNTLFQLQVQVQKLMIIFLVTESLNIQ